MGVSSLKPRVDLGPRRERERRGGGDFGVSLRERGVWFGSPHTGEGP